MPELAKQWYLENIILFGWKILLLCFGKVLRTVPRSFDLHYRLLA